MENEKLQELLKKALALPLSPGVYLMYNKAGTIIYVGKAKNLKNRVCQYFRSGSDHTPKVAKMVSLVHHFEYILCTSEYEALVLEASLIKQHQPKYNILLKDDKGYHYIRITPPPYRKLSAVKQKADDGCTYLGPYYSFYAVSQSVDQACKVFGLPTCNRQFPRDLRKGRPCLNRSLGLCNGVCTGKISLQEYEQSVDAALSFLQGGVQATLQQLEQEMNAAAENLQFEQAAKLRDRIRALQNIVKKQTVVATNLPDGDFIAAAPTPDVTCFEVFHMKGGTLADRDHFLVETEEGNGMEAFLMQYYENHPIPSRVAVNALPENHEELARYFTEKRGKKVTLFVPARGEGLRVMNLCLANAQERLLNTAGKETRTHSVLKELAGLLGLADAPNRIESYDISHTAGAGKVAGMVVFCKGKPAKSEYRRFMVQNVYGEDDTAALAEVIARRFAEYEKQKETGKGFGELPDLILLDGGKGQLSAVLTVMAQQKISVPVFGMVKDSRHHTRAIVGINGEIAIKANRSVFTFVNTLQEEVHRFAIAYHRKKTAKAMVNSQLQAIEGMGEKRCAALLKAFSGLEGIMKASVEELSKVTGMTLPVAVKVYETFHPNEGQN